MLLEDLPNHFWRLSELETLTYVPKDDRKHFYTIFSVLTNYMYGTQHCATLRISCRSYLVKDGEGMWCLNIGPTLISLDLGRHFK